MTCIIPNGIIKIQTDKAAILIMNNREVILEKALELFSSYGYDSTGVQEIASAAGVTKPTLYHYFGSKEKLLDELLSTYSGKLMRMMQPAADYQRDLPLTLYRVTKTYFEFAKEYQTYYRFHLSLWFAPSESYPAKAVASYLHNQFIMIEDIFLKASGDHGNMKGRHKRYAVSFIGMINSYISLHTKDLIQLSDELVYQAVHQFMHGIYS
ncbi:MAG: TetR/AcrR family transcriptional regulator [Firmicutes bacterium]|nr:TetR/AcrR family transcriptional regulator [Bacillota bacterium]